MKYYFSSIFFVVVTISLVMSENGETGLAENASSSTPATLTSFPTPAPNIKKIDITLLNKLITSNVRKLSIVFKKHGYVLRIAGGAVRDVLMGIQPKDLDFATDATPPQMKYMLKQERIITINVGGEKHGTVTAHIFGHNFEITTLRKDHKCDGRHMEVQFTKDWQEDAQRRDLSINCMFLDFDGTLYDYCGGEEDVKNRVIRFVGYPETRIREDYLRILRYFRFYGRVAREPDKHDELTLKHIQENKHGLSRISGERLWMEFQQIISGKFNKEIVFKMLDLGLAPFLGLVTADDLDKACFEQICELQKQLKTFSFKPITYMAALLPSLNRLDVLYKELRLSNLERDLAAFLIIHKNRTFVLEADNPLKPFQALLVEARNTDQIKSFIVELLRFKNITEDVIRMFQVWSMPKFPMETSRLRERGIVYGRQMRFVVKGLREYWVKKNFNVTETDLLYQIPDLVAEFRKFLNCTIKWTNPVTYTRWPLTNSTSNISSVVLTESLSDITTESSVGTETKQNTPTQSSLLAEQSTSTDPSVQLQTEQSASTVQQTSPT